MEKQKCTVETPEGECPLLHSIAHEICTGYTIGYTSGGIRFAAKGTAKPAEQGSPSIPHEQTC